MTPKIELSKNSSVSIETIEELFSELFMSTFNIENGNQELRLFEISDLPVEK